MTIFGAGNINTGSISSKATAVCAGLRNELQQAVDLYKFLSAQSAADLEALGFSVADYNFIMSAIADANALAQIFLTGLPPGTYPQPSSAYIYSASMRQIIGPQ